MSGTAFDRFVVPGYLDANGKFIPATGLTPIPVELPSFNITTATNGELAVTSTSKRLHIAGSGNNYVLSNGGSSAVAVAIGNASVTAVFPTADAVGGGFVILPGAIMTVSTSVGEDSYVAAICAAAATSTLYISQGSGS